MLHSALEHNWITEIPLSLIYASDDCLHEENTEMLHTHTFTELFFVTNGNGRMVLEDKIVELKPYDLVLISSNVKHAEEYSPELQEMKCYSIGISGLILQDTETASDGYLGAYTYIKNFKEDKDLIIPILDQLVKEMQNKETYYAEFTRSLMQLLICTILRVAGENTIVAPDDFHNKQVSFVRSYIEEHFAEEMTLDELADISSLNKYYLVNEFKRSFGFTPIDYLLHRRVEESKQHLIDGHLTMKEIADACGFHSQSYFNQVFKKKTDMTPSAFRRDHYKKVLLGY